MTRSDDPALEGQIATKSVPELSARSAGAIPRERRRSGRTAVRYEAGTTLVTTQTPPAPVRSGCATVTITVRPVLGCGHPEGVLAGGLDGGVGRTERAGGGHVGRRGPPRLVTGVDLGLQGGDLVEPSLGAQEPGRRRRSPSRRELAPPVRARCRRRRSRRPSS